MISHSSLFSYNFSTLSLKETIALIINKALKKESSSVCVCNVHMVVEAKKDSEFAPVLRNADLVVLDGMPLVWSLRLLKGIKAERIAGVHLMHGILERAKENPALAIYIYGSTSYVLDKAKRFIKNNYPNINLVGAYAPPFRALTTAEEEAVVGNINNSGANIVFVALGCPKQEKWIAAMTGRIPAVMLGIGIALEVLTYQQARTPVWMEKMGLEWLFRLLKEPKRLFKRYLFTNSYFLFLFIKTALRKIFGYTY
ncbi:putative N-acetylmannosaminyltransferase [Pedobacter glucosidilyticus]|nr:WecB/TagA/CpsF family glycosyltransferase [Pedobacter glucosidilyticus]KHJ38173.1 putative N-acetylmannosaminyltransferase [Pedobacter glucosidilyticus]